MPRGVPNKGYKVSRKTGLPIGKAAGAVALFPELQSQPMTKPVPVSAPVESDEEIWARLDERFDVLDAMVNGSTIGATRAMVVSGPPGLGKTHNIERILSAAENADKITYTSVSGFVRATGLYKTLYENRFKRCVILFDDSDSIFGNEDSLNILKKACDSSPVRRISWLAETRMETDEGEPLPREFEFEGQVICITNTDFDAMIARGSRLAPHFEALMSRSHYLDMGMKNQRDYMVQIKRVVSRGMLEDEGFTKSESQEIIKFIEDNVNQMRELSLRMVVKIAGLYRMSPDRWQSMARVTCMRR